MQEIAEQSIIGIMKDNVLNVRSRNEKYRNFLKVQIDNYTVEISHKNKQISSLLKLLEKNKIGSCQHQMETIPPNTNFEYVRRNHEKCRNDARLYEQDNNEDDDIIKNPPNVSLSNESIENFNNPKQFQIDNQWITQRNKKRNNNVLTQNIFMPLSMPSMDVNDYDNDDSVHEDDIFHDNINTISQMVINPSDRLSIIAT